MQPVRRRFAVVGVGNRSRTFIDALANRFRGQSELVAICDSNPGRLEYCNKRMVEQLKYPAAPTYLDADYKRMLSETKPDSVIVASIDCQHHAHIAGALEAGCDVVSEKPMTTDAANCNVVFDAVKRTGRNVRVTFNMRWRPSNTLLKKLVSQGVIGKVKQVDMAYAINTKHGADYFRRWHREKDKSGGLMIHKATHHFDLVNWLIDAVPETVFGFGKLGFYGRENAERRGVVVGPDRYTGHDTKDDPFALDLTSQVDLKQMYYDQEKYDGYRRDQNVFGDGITIEDMMSVVVRYRTGVQLNYSLNAFAPREGFTLTLTGDKGRIEHNCEYSSHVIDQAGKEAIKPRSRLVVQRMFQAPYEVEIPEAEGSHGGSDDLLTEQIFAASPPPDEFQRSAGHGQGAASLLIGAAANESFVSGKAVSIAELFPALGNVKRLSELP